MSRPRGGDYNGDMRTGRHIRGFGMFLIQKKAWWITPIVMMFIIIAALVFLTRSSLVHPFVYAMF